VSFPFVTIKQLLLMNFFEHNFEALFPLVGKKVKNPLFWPQNCNQICNFSAIKLPKTP